MVYFSGKMVVLKGNEKQPPAREQKKFSKYPLTLPIFVIRYRHGEGNKVVPDQNQFQLRTRKMTLPLNNKILSELHASNRCFCGLQAASAMRQTAPTAAQAMAQPLSRYDIPSGAAVFDFCGSKFPVGIHDWSTNSKKMGLVARLAKSDFELEVNGNKFVIKPTDGPTISSQKYSDTEEVYFNLYWLLILGGIDPAIAEKRVDLLR
jgi:hypothetical protein